MLFKFYTSPYSGIQVSKRTLKIPVKKFQMHKLFFYISHGRANIPTRSYVYYHYWGEDMSLWYMLVGRRWIMLSNTRNLLEVLNCFLSVWTSFSSSYSTLWKWSVSYCYWDSCCRLSLSWIPWQTIFSWSMILTISFHILGVSMQ